MENKLHTANTRPTHGQHTANTRPTHGQHKPSKCSEAYWFSWKIFTAPILTLTFLLLFMPSCREDALLGPERPQTTDPNAITYANIPFNEKGKMMEKFGIGIAEALKNPSFRQMLRSEALRKVNGDHDVLYHQIKNDPMQGNGPIVYDGNARTTSPGGQTLHDFLVPFFESEAELNEYEARLPLLTIFVPTLPEGSFSPETWDPTDPDQIPDVALRLNNISYVPVIGQDGEHFLLDPEDVPGWPIVVLKENERILHHSDPGFGQFDTQFVNKAGYPSGEYRLWGDEINLEFESENIDSPKRKSFFGNERLAPMHLRQAFFTWHGVPGGGWHRDYLYYGLTPEIQNGRFTGSLYNEYITSFSMLAFPGQSLSSVFNSISQEFPGNNDPRLRGWVNNKVSAFTEGDFEFSIYIFQNIIPQGTSNITSSAERKNLFINPNLLFNIMWIDNGISGRRRLYLPVISSLQRINLGKVFPLSDWNLQTKANEWIVEIHENDAAVSITEQVSIGTNRNINFGFEASIPGEVVKLGIKFGTTTNTSASYLASITRAFQNNHLGSTRVKFYDNLIHPIPSGQQFGPYFYSTGQTTFTLLPLVR